MIPNEHEELQRENIFRNLSLCVVPALLSPKKVRSWRISVDIRAINMIIVKYRFPIPRFDDLLDQLLGATIFRKIDLKREYH